MIMMVGAGHVHVHVNDYSRSRGEGATYSKIMNVARASPSPTEITVVIRKWCLKIVVLTRRGRWRS